MTGLEEVDEVDIEEAIRLELKALDGLDLLELESTSDESIKSFESIQGDFPVSGTSLEKRRSFFYRGEMCFCPDSVESFMRLLKSRGEKFQLDLDEAENALKFANHSEDNSSAKILVENLEDDEARLTPDFKEKVLLEIEECSEKEEANVFVDEEDEVISSLEETGLNELKKLESKQNDRRDQLEELFNEIREDDRLRHERDETTRVESKRTASEEHKAKMEKNMSLRLKIEEEAKLQKKTIMDLQEQLELEMTKLEKRRKEERMALEKVQREERRKLEVRNERACVIIQKTFRMFRVKAKYGGILKEKREERYEKKLKELKALDEKEKRMIEEGIRKAKEEEEKRLKEVEMEKKRKKAERKERVERSGKEERKYKKETEGNEGLGNKGQETEKENKDRGESELLEKNCNIKDVSFGRSGRDSLFDVNIDDRPADGGNVEEESRPTLDSRECHLVWETLRKNWLKQTTLWSCLSKEQSGSSTSRPKPRRPLSASQNLPTFSTEEILNSLKTPTSLDEIFVINVRDLPPRNFKIMPSCPNVKSLTVQNCGVISAAGFESCKHLLELNLSDNAIQNICCQNLDSLHLVDFKRNQLASIHGLDGCCNVRALLLDDNKITRVGKFSFNRVMHLSLRSNQLITTKGLSTWKYLQILDCSDNHLNRIDELECCPLLSILRLKGNNLQTPPCLSNHVLLREVHLGENSISSLEEFVNNWLPLLQHLYLNDNSLSTVSHMKNFPMLETLDLKNNLITDEENVLNGIAGCQELRVLIVEGNPVVEDKNFRGAIISLLPNLRCLNQEKLKNTLVDDDVRMQSIYHQICCAQILTQDALMKRHKSEMLNCEKEYSADDLVLKRLNLKIRHFKELEDLMIEHRQMHERFSVVGENETFENSIVSIKPESSKKVGEDTSLGEKHLRDTSIQNDNTEGQPYGREYPDRNNESDWNAPSNHVSIQPATITSNNMCGRRKLNDDTLISSSRREKQESSDVLKNVAENHLQIGEQEFLLRQHERPISSDVFDETQSNHICKEPQNSNVTKSILSREKSLHSNTIEMSYVQWQPFHHEAATCIQANLRGYYMRKRYIEAMKTARYTDLDLENDDFDEDVDLNMFDMDEADLENSWVPFDLAPGSGQNNWQSQSLKQQQQIKYRDDYVTNEEDNFQPFAIKKAWASPVCSPDQRIVPPIKAPSTLSEERSPPGVTQRSHRTSELSSEWGFSKSSTAELMMKRANRMKYNALRKKKLTDPEKRLKLFKKTDETNKSHGAQIVKKRKEKPRVDYFSGRQYGDNESPRRDEEESKVKKEMTFSWIYDQAVLLKGQEDEILGDSGGYHNESRTSNKRRVRSPTGISLPRMDPVILAGRNLPLVASAVGNPKASANTSEVADISSGRPHSWHKTTKTHSNPDLSLVGQAKAQSRSAKSNSAEARIVKERSYRL
ncbi:leucine-rich repeat and IQ domain-containing protein 1-like [Xenia sp. Carnegie-2017]|uniref:leucine-rich repeat and IQ domain-containing protein 1-like n=1 Tax=Xenia sp. Carnegie-2017 TaxID=2897299 RepID=UPI001F045E71|nr:leucine-rich repeat and IQ domain-containing protein 1-like [Xenia sp. Carnegie-2017]